MEEIKQIPLCVPRIEGNEWKYIKDCLDTNWVSSVGSYVDLFEKNIGEYLDVKHAVVTVNGTAAITLALQTLGIGDGDEVIVPSMTFVASVNPLKHVGAKPVFAEITSDTWVMDVGKIEPLITEKTRAILPVHIYGNMVDMEPLMEIARKHNIYVIEDATEALGSEYRRKDGSWHKAGTIGDIGTFSFNGNKLITTGAGGALVSGDGEIAKSAKHLSTQAKTMLSNGGMLNNEVGYNYRMPNILAAMGVAQLENICKYIGEKKRISAKYNHLLKSVKGIQLPKEGNNVMHSQWLYGVLVNDEYRTSRDELIEKLGRHGISSRPFFYPVHNMKPYIEYCPSDALCITEKVSSQGINLPSSVDLTDCEIVKICEIIRG